MKPAFSVVIPCRNEAGSLEACLSALDAQTFPAEAFEVIVVDGSSQDGSGRVASRHRARLVQDEAKGPAAARNLGVQAARADIVAFTDADCVPSLDWLERLAQVWSESAFLDGVAGALRMPRDTLLGRLEDNDAQRVYCGFITSNVAYRREAILAVGGFDESLTCCEDYDLAWRIMDAGRIVVHDPRPVVTHAPPEVAGSLALYLRKQYWYAKSDVPAHLRAIARGPGHGRASAMAGGADALRSSFVAAGLLGGLYWRRPLLVGASLAALGMGPARRAMAAAREIGGEPLDLPKLGAVAAARQLVRGAGTLAGLARAATAVVAGPRPKWA